MEIQTLFNLFIKDSILSGKSRTTLTNYRYSINSLLNYIKATNMQQDIESASKQALEGYFLYGLKVHKWGKYTHWTNFKNLKAFFTWCARNKYLDNNPLVAVAKPKQPNQYPKSFSQSEVIEILHILDEINYRHRFTKLRNKAIVTMLLFTGIRKSELLSLKYSDVDLIDDFIKIQHGKGDKFREIPIEQTVLKKILIDYLEKRDKIYNKQDWFFKPTPCDSIEQSGNMLSERSFRIIFERLSSRLHKRIYAHKFRHSFATFLLEKTGDIYVLKELLGHSDIKTTCIYLSTTRQKKVEAINKLSLDY